MHVNDLLKLAPKSADPDPYGHGSHVAAVAAGAGNYQSPESGGIAPGADLYDVRVLDERGIGNMADVLAGIDWTMQRARQANIRVLNLSLGAASTDSFLVDPLARATRSATAMAAICASLIPPDTIASMSTEASSRVRFRRASRVSSVSRIIPAPSPG